MYFRLLDLYVYRLIEFYISHINIYIYLYVHKKGEKYVYETVRRDGWMMRLDETVQRQVHARQHRGRDRRDSLPSSIAII